MDREKDRKNQILYNCKINTNTSTNSTHTHTRVKPLNQTDRHRQRKCGKKEPFHIHLRPSEEKKSETNTARNKQNETKPNKKIMNVNYCN